ncbi:MAG: coproporphyrinogen III oxidase family protein [Treponema sp.]|nr:coproporphyrinogen III oxidase family protein [Treponema sp.]
MEASLYIHVPFCSPNPQSRGGKCDYCDFYSVPLNSSGALLDQYVKILLSEAEGFFKTLQLSRVPTVYVGGGTPSVLGPERVRQLLGAILGRIKLETGGVPEEVTLEANPETAGEALLEAAREGGASRLSLGVQSFHGPSRRRAGRGGDEGLLDERLALGARYFPQALSADLISGFPGQDEEILARDIGALLAHGPAHVSLYALSVDPASELYGDPDRADQIWLAGRDLLEKAGYRQYEISNFCPPGNESLHNLRYWAMKSWFALGPSASGTLIHGQGALRYTIPADLETWLSRGPCALEGGPFLPHLEELDRGALIKDSLLMGFRCLGGPDGELFNERFGTSIESLIPRTLGSWKDRLQKDRLALNREGLLFLNSFLVDVFGELEDTSLG